MKILWVSHSSSLGGAEKSLVESAQGASGRGIENLIIVPGCGELKELAERIGIPTKVQAYPIWMHTGFLKRPFYYKIYRLPKHLLAVLRIQKIIKAFKPDVVITNTMTICVGAIAARLSHVPHIWYIREFGWEDHRAKFDYGDAFSKKMIDLLSDRIIVNSQAVKEHHYINIPSDKFRVVYNAVNVDRPFQEKDSVIEPWKLLMVGRVSLGKRQEDAIRAVKILKDEGFRFRLQIIGSHEGDYFEFLQNLVHSLGLQECVVFHDFVKEPFDFFVDSDVLLVCSEREAFGRVTVEAMKLGVPVIASRSGGSVELIDDGKTGFLFKPGNVIELAQKIKEILLHDGIRLQILRNANKWVSNKFSLERHIDDLVKVVNEII